jgi:hypothetical protein
MGPGLLSYNLKCTVILVLDDTRVHRFGGITDRKIQEIEEKTAPVQQSTTNPA